MMRFVSVWKSVGLPAMISEKSGKFHFYAPIGSLVRFHGGMKIFYWILLDELPIPSIYPWLFFFVYQVLLFLAMAAFDSISIASPFISFLCDIIWAAQKIKGFKKGRYAEKNKRPFPDGLQRVNCKIEQTALHTDGRTKLSEEVSLCSWKKNIFFSLKTTLFKNMTGFNFDMNRWFKILLPFMRSLYWWRRAT